MDCWGKARGEKRAAEEAWEGEGAVNGRRVVVKAFAGISDDIFQNLFNKKSHSNSLLLREKSVLKGGVHWKHDLNVFCIRAYLFLSVRRTGSFFQSCDVVKMDTWGSRTGDKPN